MPNLWAAELSHPGPGFDLRDGFRDPLRKYSRDHRERTRVRAHGAYGVRPKYAAAFFVETVKAQFLGHVHDDQNAAGHADGQSRDIDQ